MQLTADHILDALKRELGLNTDGIDASTPLFSGGTIDSFSLVSLLLLVETQAGITVRPMDVTLENFDTIDRMLAYVGRAQHAKASAGGVSC